MQIIFHTGVHCTDDDRLLKCLLRNKQTFSERGVAVPGPGRYRELLSQLFRAMATSEPAGDAREVLMDAILDDETADRMILSNASFLGSRRYSIMDGQLYPNAPDRVGYLHRLFPGDQLEIFMGLRNPASFVPAALGKISPQNLNGIMGGMDPRHLRWSDCLNRIRSVAPDLRMTIWCNEDTPFIWAQIIREMARLDPGEKITGGFDLLKTIISSEGMQRFRAYLHKHPRMNETQKRRVIAAFLDKFAIPSKLEEEIDLPGWTDGLVQDMTEIYDEDMSRIRRIPGVNLITP